MIQRRCLWQDRCGAAALEFALVAPIFLALVIGTVETARWAWGAAATRDLAARAARCINVTPDLCGTTAATQKHLAQSAPIISRSATLDFTKSECGIRVVAIGGFPAMLTPGLGEAVAATCAG
ncbi:MAG: pilus assembly protein [Sandarakinorhabdus sp.]|nr:pilus assembly protein [Sandarakinorhabdus sp.]